MRTSPALGKHSVTGSGGDVKRLSRLERQHDALPFGFRFHAEDP